jgi:hypothetical protein
VSNDPQDPRKPTEDPGLLDETLSRLEARLDRASEVAERLIIEAATRAARGAGSESGAGPVGEEGPVGEAAGPGTGGTSGTGGTGGASGASGTGGTGGTGGTSGTGGTGATGGGSGASGEGRKPPPAGWQRSPGGAPGATGASGRADARARGEFDILLEVVAALRERIPPELQRRLGEALREVLLALRALIDWYLERTERRRADPAEVQDIPII